MKTIENKIYNEYCLVCELVIIFKTSWEHKQLFISYTPLAWRSSLSGDLSFCFASQISLDLQSLTSIS